MGIYIASNGEEKKTEEMNSFNLVNGLTKASRECVAVGNDPQSVPMKNVQALSVEILARLDTRTPEEKAKAQ